MTVSNPEGSIEVHPGSRGHSVVSVGLTPDGKSARFTTDEPRTLNPIRLPDGPKGDKGNPGAPGEGKIVTDDTAGHRVFMWDARLAGHQMTYGDTGVRLLADGTTWVRRTDNLVETNALDPAADLPAGFRPISPEAVGGVFTTADEWPTELPGTEQAPPVLHYGLRDYDAAVASGYPGTAEEWLNTLYRVVLPPAGTTGQVLTRTAAGTAWQAPPSYGPGAWQSITLDGWEPSNGSGAFARLSNGSVELYGLLGYRGATTTVGGFSGSFLRIGVLPPALAPQHGVDHPITTYRASDNQPTLGRIIISTQGVISLGAFASAKDTSEFTAKANVTAVNISSTSFALRNSGPA